jgi:hypothetical protein
MVPLKGPRQGRVVGELRRCLQPVHLRTDRVHHGMQRWDLHVRAADSLPSGRI